MLEEYLCLVIFQCTGLHQIDEDQENIFKKLMYIFEKKMLYVLKISTN